MRTFSIFSDYQRCPTDTAEAIWAVQEEFVRYSRDRNNDSLRRSFFKSETFESKTRLPLEQYPFSFPERGLHFGISGAK